MIWMEERHRFLWKNGTTPNKTYANRPTKSDKSWSDFIELIRINMILNEFTIFSNTFGCEHENHRQHEVSMRWMRTGKLVTLLALIANTFIDS